MKAAKLNNANDLFYSKKYREALAVFLENKEYYQAGLCSLLIKDTTSAKKYWNLGKKRCPASKFGLSVLRMIELKTDLMPSFFQTRAQLEIYISLFIENNLIEWAENLISCADSLYYSNPESYKFIARALYANGYFELAISFCKKSLSVFYSDPEALLITSQCYYLLKNNADALDMVNRVLDMVPDYFPALIFQNILKEEIEKKYRQR